jgi:hypothetical protein
MSCYAACSTCMGDIVATGVYLNVRRSRNGRGASRAHPHLSSLHIFTRAQRTRVQFCPQFWFVLVLVRVHPHATQRARASDAPELTRQRALRHRDVLCATITHDYTRTQEGTFFPAAPSGVDICGTTRAGSLCFIWLCYKNTSHANLSCKLPSSGMH